MKLIEGGVTAAKGFKAAGVHAGIKPTSSPDRLDLALIVSDVPCNAAGTFTTNCVKADPVLLDIENLKNGTAQAVIANCMIANACAPEGKETSIRMMESTARALDLNPQDVVVSSTGVIGVRLNVEAIEAALPELIGQLADTPDGSDHAARAIMTTDTVKKEFAYEFELGGKTCHMGGISKGSGMIHPKMGTMLCYITTDVAISKELLNEALHNVVKKTFNRISVDGDMSTNDTCVILANGQAGNMEITEKGMDYFAFESTLMQLCTELARSMAKDGEGASHLITCLVMNAKTEDRAETLAKSVINSSLTKAAIFGADANWGRVLAALGYSGEVFDPSRVEIAFISPKGHILVCSQGKGVDFDEELAKEILEEDEVQIHVNMNEGMAQAICWGCDLTYEYVKINGDYRT